MAFIIKRPKNDYGIVKKITNTHSEFTLLFLGNVNWHHKSLISTVWFPWGSHLYRGILGGGNILKQTLWRIYTANIYKMIGFLIQCLLISWYLTGVQKIHLNFLSFNAWVNVAVVVEVLQPQHSGQTVAHEAWYQTGEL